MRTPRATYRLQLHAGFTLNDAVALVPYLRDLGVSDVYASPILQATTGSTHGYHVADPTRINVELGGEDALRALSAALHEHDMGLVVDIVPNHLAASVENPWWVDVLERGQASRYAHWFDIDWEAGDETLVLPILGRPYGEALEAGELRVGVDDVGAHVRYFDTRLPLDPDTVPAVVGAAPTLDALNGTTGDPRSFDLLDRLLRSQHYRLVHWRSGTPQINYRRFFDITDLVGIRIELPEVFRDRHAALLRALADGAIVGIRVDHVDGLRDPSGYLEDLQRAASDAVGTDRVYIVVEKIVEGDEPIPREWPVAGTTGYEFLNDANALFIDPEGLQRLGATYTEVTGRRTAVSATLHARKHAVMRDLFRGEIRGLAQRLTRLAREDRHALDLEPRAIEAALVAVTAWFPVYRTYGRGGALLERDLPFLDGALRVTAERDPELDPRALDFLGRVLHLEFPPDAPADLRERWEDVVLRWQQLTGPAMAKGFEDTTFYVENRLLSLNEVGVDAHGVQSPPSVAVVRDRLARRAEEWPQTMNATSTHDTKRSEDLRARLDVLTEVPDQFDRAAREWRRLAAPLRSQVKGHEAPDANEEWALLQSLVGMWPLEPDDEAGVSERLKEFAQKMLREAKTNSSWLDPDEEHEAAVGRYIDGVFAVTGPLDVVRELVDRIAIPGCVNSLAQTLLKMVVPGVPDTYQGTELWDFSLVDPDNRRPVDFARRRDLLDRVTAAWASDPRGAAAEALVNWRRGDPKLLVTWLALRQRHARPELFRDGDLRYLDVDGEHAERIVPVARVRGDDWVAAVVPRLTAKLVDAGRWPLGEVWGGTTLTLPSGERALIADVLSDLPVALITSPRG